MRTCQQLAERFAESALANYGRDGELTPAMIVLGDDQDQLVSVIPHVRPENHGMPGAILAIGAVLGPLFAGRYLVVISETWISTPVDEKEARSLRRGELEERALGGDTTIETGLLVAVFNLDDIDASHTLLYNVGQGYRRHDLPGRGEGEIGDTLTELAPIWQSGRGTRPPGSVPPFIAQLAVDMLGEHIHALMMPEPAE